jgi:hypothetical protein
MIPPRRSIPLDYEVEPARDAGADWPEFAPDDDSFGFWCWCVMAVGAVLTAFGLGWLVTAVLA